MLGYLEFLLESNLTISIYFSKELKAILYAIKNSSLEGHKIAEKLLDLQGKGKQDQISFFDISQKNNMISFIQANRVERLWPEYPKKTATNNSDDFQNWCFNQWVDSDTYGLKSGVWVNQRTEVSVGSLTNRLISEFYTAPTSKELENFVNLYKSYWDKEHDQFSRFELIEGEEIRKWYLYENYESSTGQLGNSCMRYAKCQSYLDIYVKNPEVVKLLILKSKQYPEKISGRALLWIDPAGGKILDRIYTNNDSDKVLFLQWVNSKDDIDYIDDVDIEDWSFKLKNFKFEKYPYLDTFAYLNKETGELRSDESLWPGQGYIRLQKTSGDFYSDLVVWSEYHQEYLEREDVVWSAQEEDWLRRNSAVYIRNRDMWVSEDFEEVAFIVSENDYYLLEDLVYSDYLDRWLEMSKFLIEIEYGGEKIRTLPEFVFLSPDAKEFIFVDKLKNSRFKITNEDFKNYLTKNQKNLSKETIQNLLDTTKEGSSRVLELISKSSEGEITDVLKSFILSENFASSSVRRTIAVRASITNSEFFKKLENSDLKESIQTLDSSDIFFLEKIALKSLTRLIDDSDTLSYILKKITIPFIF